MSQSLYQQHDNLPQITALQNLAAETRQLIDNIVETAAETQALNDACQQIAAINAQLSQHRSQSENDQRRPLQHFNFAAAQTQPNEILPYSPVTGHFNPISPPVSVTYDAETQQISATVSCNRGYEGPPGMVHGAVIAGIYDQIMAMAATCIGKGGPTAFLNTQFLLPTLLHQELHFSAWIDRIEDRKIYIQAHCKIGDDIVTSAEALCIEHRA